MSLKLGNVAAYIDSYMQQKGLVKIVRSLLGIFYLKTMTSMFQK